MPIINGIGQSKYTEGKHDDFGTIMHISAYAVKGILNKHPYRGRQYLYFDITAGDGGTFTEPGSPRIAQDMLERCHLPYRMILIEQEENNVFKLSSTVAMNGSVEIFCGDHSAELPKLIKPAIVPKPYNWHGILFCDTNGTEPPWDLLADFADVYKKIDIVLYMAPTNFKRVRRYAEKREGTKLPCLAENIACIGKKTWIVREPRGPHQWTFYIGSNWDNYPDYKSRGYYRLDSPQGKRISQTVSLTAEERQSAEQGDQLMLPFEEAPYRTYQEYLAHPRFQVVRAQAIERSQGVCEMCHAQRVTEVHHLIYPKWGTFETNADNLLAICHECHCKLHEKEH